MHNQNLPILTAVMDQQFLATRNRLLYNHKGVRPSIVSDHSKTAIGRFPIVPTTRVRVEDWVVD